MGLRFRRSVRLAPGLRLNLGRRGASLSLGGRGASLNIGRRGVYGNVGLPGTGLSYRERLDRPSRSDGPRGAPRRDGPKDIRATLRLTDDGTLRLLDRHGQPLPDALRDVALRQHREAAVGLLERALAEHEAEQREILCPHLKTPPLSGVPRPYSEEPFPEPRPQEPVAPRGGFFAALFGIQARREARYRDALAAYRVAMGAWRAARANHEAAQGAARRAHERVLQGDPQAMEACFEVRLSRIVWPRETLVDFELDGDGLHADVDLPEIEDLPRGEVRLRRRDLCLETTEKGPVALRRDYQTHIHSIGFRLAGEAFAALPTLRQVIASGYSQRRSRATGAIEDEYLFSVRIGRPDWERIDFDHLDVIDPIQALERFELRRDMSTTGVFRPIEPFA